ncbi:MAG: uracil-DNA glycosylase [Oscillospiraceae bacterium]|nr:uracil-DNA glycosylase [Oscillospiraceae bacterium]
MVNLGNDWDKVLEGEFEKEYYLKLRQFLKEEYTYHTVYPNMYDIFNALKYTAYSDVKVVILGQDPYHGPNQAHGLSFSVQKGIMPPPSLVNIYKEIENEFGVQMPKNYGCLTKWAKQGVLLLNTTLTVRAHNANSHKDAGWQIFTDNVIKKLNEREKPVVFLLWGSHSIKKKALIDETKHLVLTSVHPSPLSAYRGFFGCGHFKKANDFLAGCGETPIDWTVQEE